MSALFAALALAAAGLARADAPARWSRRQANDWYARQPWLVGSNYIPSDAINELEMWQAATFDPARIDRELGWAESLGLDTMRVFLHDLPWRQDPAGFRGRIDRFLSIASRHHIRPLFVLFDSCWDPRPEVGPQHPPRPGVHNSGWVQSPGAKALEDPAEVPALKDYVTGVVGAFAGDPRVLGWDIWNEPDNVNHGSYGPLEPKDKVERVLALLPQAFAWARSVHPIQPLTSAVWTGDWAPERLSPMARLQLELSDVVSFHDYGKPEQFERRLRSLLPYGRPILCTEYMARGNGSTFEGTLPIARRYRVAAINWGLVAGKTQTYLPWDSWAKPYTDRAPTQWFHEIFREDGTPYRREEAAFIRDMIERTPRPGSTTKEPFGKTPDGRPVELYRLENRNGLEADVATYGATLVSLRTPDRDGHLDDVVLGYDSLDRYESGESYFGATVGRYANRIAHGAFVLDDKTYRLPKNNGENTLHGGIRGFSRALWTALPIASSDGQALELRYRSPDGEEGFPGTLETRLVMTLTDGGALRFDYEATADRPTVVNLANHAYFNLTGGARDVLEHRIEIDADRFTPVDAGLIPTGELRPVEGTPFDLRTSTAIGARIDAADEQLRLAGGFDHNFVLRGAAGALARAARVIEPSTGRALEVWTTEPGLQFYTGNFLDGEAGKSGVSYRRRWGLCLETQHFPDSPNRQAFPSVVLRPGATYRTRTEYRFSTTP